jgi:hypothetical protein
VLDSKGEKEDKTHSIKMEKKKELGDDKRREKSIFTGVALLCEGN